MKIAYITGLGRSGSTLLDLILAAHSQAFSVGEVKTLNRYTAASATERNDNPRQSCTCGADSVWVCPVWSQVEAHLQAEHGVSLRDLRIKADDDERFRTVPVVKKFDRFVDRQRRDSGCERVRLRTVAFGDYGHRVVTRPLSSGTRVVDVVNVTSGASVAARRRNVAVGVEYPERLVAIRAFNSHRAVGRRHIAASVHESRSSRTRNR